MSEYIIFWKDAPGQQVSTIVDAHNQPVRRDFEYVQAQGLLILRNKSQVLDELKRTQGVRYAITVELARATLGWDI